MDTTINEKEVEKFSRIADEWWDVKGKFKPLHDINPLRLEFITGHIADKFNIAEQKGRYLSGLKVLDIGCGGGLLSEPFARLGAQVTGIDASEKNVKVAKLHSEKVGLDIEYINTSIEQLNAPEYDVILNMEVIEHVDNPELFLASSINLLKPNGLMFVATINRTLKSMLFAKVAAEYILRWLPIGTHDWNKFLKPSEIVDMTLKNGSKKVMHVEDIKGMTYNPITSTWRLSNDTTVNYLMCLQAKES